MAYKRKKINVDVMAKILGDLAHPEYLHKEAKIIQDKKQLSVRIPKKFAEMANIDPKKDKVNFILVPNEDDNENEFTLKAEIKRGVE
jgi:hypothetical protein